MARPKKYGVRQEKELKTKFLQLVGKNLGIISTTLKSLGISRWYYDKWLTTDEDFKKEMYIINETTIDFVESKLFNLINTGDKAAIIFFLKCRGRSRGYIERAHIDGDIKLEPIKIVIEELKEKKEE